jgi:hypothetical protein
MTNEDYSKVPPPHLLKKFSEQAREDSQKRGHPGYCKTFAKLCIDWAFQEAAMDDLRVASAEVSGAASQPGSSSETMTQEPYPTLAIGRQLPKIDCPKHGIHSHTIESTIPGHEGHWCQLCWLESLGEPLPVIE